MKITGQDVPPDLIDQYAELVSSNPDDGQGHRTTRTRRAVRAPGRRREPSKTLKAAKALAAQLAAYWGRNVANAAGQRWLSDRATAIYRGQIELDYWEKATPAYVDALRYLGSSEEDFDPPPYAFPDPSNRPTLTTWAADEYDAGQARYAGALVGELYCDQEWVVATALYYLPPHSPAGIPPPAWVLIQGTIAAEADQRGSRPMFGLICRAQRGEEQDMLNLDQVSPDIDGISHYFRYRILHTQPPFYQATESRRIVQAMSGPDTPFDVPTAAVHLGPRPMMGHGNNGNESVATTWTGTADLYLPNPCAEELRRPISRDAGGDWYSHNLDAGTADLLPYQPDWTYASLSRRAWLQPATDNTCSIRYYDGTPLHTITAPDEYLSYVGSFTPTAEGWWATVGNLDPDFEGAPPAQDIHYDYSGNVLARLDLAEDRGAAWTSPGLGVLTSGHTLHADGTLRLPGDAGRWQIATPLPAWHYLYLAGNAYAVAGNGAVYLIGQLPAGAMSPSPPSQTPDWTTCRQVAAVGAAPTRAMKGNKAIVVFTADGYVLVNSVGIVGRGDYTAANHTGQGITTCNQ